MEWNDQYNIGIVEIDKQHHELFRLVNKIKIGISRKDNEQLIIKKAIHYSKSFKTEFQNKQKKSHTSQKGVRQKG